MLDALLGSPGRVVATVRERLEYLAEPDESGRVHRRSIGLDPVIHEGSRTQINPTITVQSA